MKVRKFSIILALAALAGFVTLQMAEFLRAASREGIAPYQRFGHWVANASDSFSAAFRSVSVEGENIELRERNQQLVSEITAAKAAASELGELRRMLALADETPGLAFARVLSRGAGDGWSQRLRLDKGRRHGIRVNNPVLGGRGLVGRVIEVTATTSDVLLITDPNSRIACSLEPRVPSARGVLVGRGRIAHEGYPELLHTLEPLHLAYLQKDLEIPSEATVVTSGLGGVFPRGLAIGMLVESEPDESGLFLSGKVVPFVDFDNLNVVAVMRMAAYADGGDGDAP